MTTEKTSKFPTWKDFVKSCVERFVEEFPRVSDNNKVIMQTQGRAAVERYMYASLAVARFPCPPETMKWASMAFDEMKKIMNATYPELQGNAGRFLSEFVESEALRLDVEVRRYQKRKGM